MSLLFRIAVFLPAVYLVMIVYSAPLAPTAKGVAEIAARKTVKVVGWTVLIVASMWILAALFLP